MKVFFKTALFTILGLLIIGGFIGLIVGSYVFLGERWFIIIDVSILVAGIAAIAYNYVKNDY